MTYQEMRTVLQWLVAADGRYAGADALRDQRGRWAVCLHDSRVERTVQLGDFQEFMLHWPHFLTRPRPQPLKFWAGGDAHLHLAHVLGILHHVEDAYPRWRTQAMLGNEQGRYEVLLLDEGRSAGVHRIQDIADFRRVFPLSPDAPLAQ
ncbi:MAG: hypothetical protein NVSMB65_19700 [Chloroflexota bacterium]